MALQMHGTAGLHSAMAIKRQRRLREQAKKRALERERRLSSRTSSMDSIDREHHYTQKKPARESTLATSIGMLHLGVCFLVFGLFLIGSGLLPDDMVSWRSGGWWNELVATGIFVAALGIFLIILNRVLSKHEEENLNEYVQRQLTRSRSGHRLERDVETGCLTTKNHRRLLEKKREDQERGLGSSDDIPVIHSSVTKTSPTHMQNGDAYLEKIIEEDVFMSQEEMPAPPDYDSYMYSCRENISTTTTASPGTPSETRELIENDSYYHSNNNNNQRI
ncbi:hypothetical protein MML48_8g00010548 [Holotrichia oblita]|uniref:Uncharacterized protein n=1 Tax=Holotrichia oblita TaxID=644536 RepID=A0ACB9SM92_HOLOL|nr:hypothetical protein MML48_8g00010548 [Holotrichia oblita]